MAYTSYTAVALFHLGYTDTDFAVVKRKGVLSLHWHSAQTQPDDATIAAAELPALKANKKAQAARVKDTAVAAATEDDEYILVRRLRLQIDNIVAALASTSADAWPAARAKIIDIAGTQPGDPIYDKREEAFNRSKAEKEDWRTAYQSIAAEIDALPDIASVEAYDATSANVLWP